MTNSIRKNIVLTSFNTIFRLLNQILVFLLLARILEPEVFGILAFGASLGLLASASSDFGMSLMALRDMSQQRYAPESYLGNMLSQKLLLALGTFLVGAVYCFAVIPSENLTVGVIYLVYGAVNSFVMIFSAMLMARNKYHIDSGGVLAETFSVFTAVGATYLLDLDVVIVATVLLLAKLLQLFVLSLGYQSAFNVKVRFRWDLEIQRDLILRGWSFALMAFASIAVIQIETQFLAATAENEDVGIFQACFRIALLLTIIVQIASNVWLPILSKEAIKDDRGHLSKTSQHLSDLLLGIACISVVFCFGFNKQILYLVYGLEYSSENATFVFPILVTVVAMRVVNSVPAIILTVMDKQKYRVICVCTALATGIMLNSWLTPIYGIKGAAMAALLSHLPMSILYQIFSQLFLGHSLLRAYQWAALTGTGALSWFAHDIDTITGKVLVVATAILILGYLLRSSLIYFVYGLIQTFNGRLS